MRAVADVVDEGALRGEFSAHPVVQAVQLLLGEKPARDAGLIGEDKHEKACHIEPSDGLCRIGHPADPVPRADIAIVVIDDPVAIEEGRRAQRPRGIG